jgi:hypothetical protein
MDDHRLDGAETGGDGIDEAVMFLPIGPCSLPQRMQTSTLPFLSLARRSPQRRHERGTMKVVESGFITAAAKIRE